MMALNHKRILHSRAFIYCNPYYFLLLVIFVKTVIDCSALKCSVCLNEAFAEVTGDGIVFNSTDVEKI